MKLKFMDWNCEVVLGKYNNGRTSIQLVASEDGEDICEGEPIATASVNIPTIPLASDEVMIKNYSENEGILEALTQANIVKPTGKCVDTGFVSVPVCKLLI